MSDIENLHDDSRRKEMKMEKSKENLKGLAEDMVAFGVKRAPMKFK
jgi:hypothetical protein